MVSADDEGLNAARHIATYAKLIGLQTGLLVQSLSYADVARMVSIDSETEEVEAGDDPLSTLLVEGMEALACEDDRCEIRPIASIAALFDRGPLQKSLKSKLYMAMSLRDTPIRLAAALVTSLFLRDETLGTQLFTQSYCVTHGLPRFDKSWTFIDIVASRASPAGGLLVVHAVLAATRAKQKGICAVAATSGGHRLLRSLGFTCHAFRDHGQRHMCYMRLPAELSFQRVMQRLRFEGGRDIVESVCWRDALSSRALSSVVGRC